MQTSDIPVTLLDPVFGILFDEIKTYKPVKEDIAFVLQLALKMADVNLGELERNKRFLECCQGYGIALPSTSILGTHFTTDGHACKNGFPYLIVECKDELGQGGADPYHQTACCYRELLRTKKDALPKSVLPCLLIFFAGK
jgi:hypothetical protein